MLFAFSVFFVSIFLLNLKVVVGAVVIKNLIVALSDKMAVFVDFCLDEIALRAENIQGTVNIVESVGRLFQKLGSSFKRRPLACRFQNPGINKVRENGVDVVFEFIFVF